MNNYIVKSSKESDIKEWEFSVLDKACINLTIKGMWVYDHRLDEEKLMNSLAELLNYYPHLSGMMKGTDYIECNNKGVAFQVVENKNISIKDASKKSNSLDDFGVKINLNDYKKGKAAPLSVRVTHVGDGSIVCVHCIHNCLDGHSFYLMMKEWGQICRGEKIENHFVNQKLLQSTDNPTKAEVIKDVTEKGWYKLGFKQLLHIIFYNISGKSKRISSIIIPKNEINNLRDEAAKSGIKIGTHSAISAIIMKKCMNFNALKEEKEYSNITVTDIRGRMSSIKPDYVGNATANIVTKSLKTNDSVIEIAKKIQDNLNHVLSNEDGSLDEFMNLYLNTVRFMVPFVGFDLEGMNAKKPTTIYVNNLLRFPVYDVDFGGGEPVESVPNDLPDMVKLWQTKNGDVMVVFRGYLEAMNNE